MILLTAGVVVAASAIAVLRFASSDGSHAVGSTEDFSARFAGYEAAPEPNGEMSKIVWPDFVLNGGPEVKRLYEFQVTHGELMRYMPCFCGCGQSAGHMSNRDCYVSEVNLDGSVVFDSMAPT
jgi:uncharacterized protein with PCYCGC motif